MRSVRGLGAFRQEIISKYNALKNQRTSDFVLMIVG
jgi:hypothetical protein